MESSNDKVRAFLYTLGLHAICALLMVAGLWWTHEARPVTMPGPVIEATLIGPTAAPRSRASAAKPKPAAPKPVAAAPPPPKSAPPPSQPQQQDLIEQQRVVALAEQKAEQAQREQEEKHRQEQVLLEEQQKRKKLEDERQKQLADIRRQREAMEKKLKQEQIKLAQLEDKHKADQQKTELAQQVEQEAKQAQTGAGGQDNDLLARYTAAIQAAVTNNWNRPDTAQPGLRCTLDIIQIPGGDVISAKVVAPCNADQVTRNSIEQAVMKAAPLPYQSYEKVFSREINFNFKYDG